MVKDALLLSEREYVCTRCGLVMDRDLNAALNLKQIAAESLPDAQNGRGDDAGPLPMVTTVVGEASTEEARSDQVSESGNPEHGDLERL